VLIPGRLPIVENPGSGLQWIIDQERECVASLEQEEREVHLEADTTQSSG